MKTTAANHRHALGVSRREILQVGYSGLLGIGLPALLAPNRKAAANTGPGGKKGKSILLIFLTGGPSQLDTFDMKPSAPPEIRGNFRPIATRTPGVHICEHLPRLAARSDRFAIIRSMAHRNPAHLMATHHVLTGATVPGKPADAPIDKNAAREDWPCYGGALSYLRPHADGIPSGVTLPYHLVEGPLTWPGQNAGFFGARHDPWQIHQNPNAPHFRFEDLRLPVEFTVDRLHGRQALLEQVNNQRVRMAALAESQAFASQQRQAFAFLAAGKIARAFELEREPDTVRDRYGRHLFGQSLLLSRRLLEAGVPIVQANMGHVQTWDNHSHIFQTLQNRLLPPLDQGVAALLDDLEARGMLDETLVVIMGEFGRTPKLSLLPGQTVLGRDHWAHVFFAVFAGAGVRGGQVIGQSDKIAAYPVTHSYSPSDVGATVYHALGISPEAEIHDRLGRPSRLNNGQVIHPLFTGAARHG